MFNFMKLSKMNISDEIERIEFNFNELLKISGRTYSYHDRLSSSLIGQIHLAIEDLKRKQNEKNNNIQTKQG